MRAACAWAASVGSAAPVGKCVCVLVCARDSDRAAPVGKCVSVCVCARDSDRAAPVGKCVCVCVCVCERDSDHRRPGPRVSGPCGSCPGTACANDTIPSSSAVVLYIPIIHIIYYRYHTFLVRRRPHTAGARPTACPAACWGYGTRAALGISLLKCCGVVVCNAVTPHGDAGPEQPWACD